MQSETLQALVSDIICRKSESQTIELKSASQGCPTRLFDTLSAFSNQDDGGVIIFGIDEDDDYHVSGVYDAQDLQKHVAEQCRQMEPPVRALFSICEFAGKIVVSSEIPGVDISQRPVYYRGVGRVKGSYVRVGDSDEHMSDCEIYSFEAFRRSIQDDIRTVDHARLLLLDEDRLSRYISAIKQDRRNFSNNVTDEEILELMGVTSDGKPTLAGLLTFSKYPQAYFPQLCITAVSLPGTEYASVGDNEERFLDNQRITGSIPEMLNDAVEFVRRNGRTKTIIDSKDGHREDRPEYPPIAIREAVLNALVHRDYSIHTERRPIRIEMYRDRIEITSSGGLYGRLPLASLGSARPDTRNVVLADMLEFLKITENRYSGIPTMRSELAKAGLPAPEFSVIHGEFKVIMRNSYMNETNYTTKDIVEFCVTPRTREEIVTYVGKSKNYVMSQMVSPLVNNGELSLTLPDKPRSSKQKFVKSKKS